MEKKTEKSFILIKTRTWAYVLFTGIIITLLSGQGDVESSSGPGLKLWGTIVSGKGRSYAAIEDSKQKRQKLCKEGDLAGNAKIKKILRKKVILDMGGKDIILRCESKKRHPNKQAKPTKTEPNPRLRGTITSQGRNYAVIEDSGRLQELYREGEQIGHAFVKKILSKSVILDIFDKDEILLMDEKKAETPDISAKTDKPDSQNMKLSDDFIAYPNLLTSYVQDSFKDISFMKQIKIRPHFTNGEPDGLAFSRIRPDSVFRKLGFRRYDILTALDGQNIRSADDAMKFFKKLKTSSDFRFQIKRKRQLITIHYKISGEKVSLTQEKSQIITSEHSKVSRSPKRKKRIANAKPVIQDNMDVITPTQTSDQNQQETDRFVSINFNDTDISAFIKFISNITGKQFMISPGVKGKVNIAGPSTISSKEAYEVLEAVLDVHGYTLADNDGVAEIIPSRKRKIPESDSPTEEIIHLFNPVTPETIPVQPSDQNAEQSVRIDFSNADMDVFIRSVGEITGRNFVISPRVRGKVTIMSPSEISAKQVYRLFKTVLETHGFTTAEAGPVTKIIPSDLRIRAWMLIADSKSVIQKQAIAVKDIPDKTFSSHKPENITVNFRNTDMRLYIEFISELTGTNVVLHPRLNKFKRNISFFCPRSFPVKKIGELLDIITDFYHFSVIGTDVATLIIPSSDPLIKVLQMSSAGYQKNNKDSYDAGETVSSQIPGNEKKSVSIEFKNVSISVFVEYISMLTIKNFVAASHNLCKKVTLSRTDMSVQETYDLFELTLKEQGLISVDAGMVTKIIPIAEER